MPPSEVRTAEATRMVELTEAERELVARLVASHRTVALSNMLDKTIPDEDNGNWRDVYYLAKHLVIKLQA